MKNILVIRYHKTGVFLFNQILSHYTEDIILKDIISITNNPILKNKYEICNNEFKFPYINNFILKNKYNFYLQESPSFFFDIKEFMPNINKIIHFIRDPYDQCISNFLYHIQEESPEEWFINQIPIDYNYWFDEKILNYIFKKININLDITTIKKAIGNIYDNYPKNNITNYYEYLKSMPPKIACILESLRFIFGSCEILREALIFQELKKNSKNIVLNVTLNDFKIYKLDDTIEKLNKFIFTTEIYNQINILDIKNKIKKNYKLGLKGNHITFNKISKNDRKILYDSLREYKYISLILDHILKILF
jgi:hypothetical protein